jgi:hypothetical protein
VAIICVVVICIAAFGWHFVHSEITAHRLTNEVAEYRTRAEQGDADAQNKLGALYYTGKGVPKDYGEAVRWYRKSAEQGYAKAEFNLSYMYQHGKGVPLNFVEAERWCRKAAEQGNARAEEGLGYLYYRGEGVPQSYAEAARWYQKSADQGDANAQYVLGYMYYYGYGVEKDRFGAVRLFRQAAAQGNVDARRALGPVRWSKTRMVITLLELLATLFFGVTFLTSARKPRSLHDKVAGLAALLLAAAVALNSFRHYHFAYAQSSPTLTLFYFGNHLLSGVIVGVLTYILDKRSAKVVLITAATIFIGVIGLSAASSGLIQLFVAVFPLDLLGLSIGMSIPSAIFLWLDRKGRGQMTGDDGQAALPLTRA